MKRHLHKTTKETPKVPLKKTLLPSIIRQKIKSHTPNLIDGALSILIMEFALGFFDIRDLLQHTLNTLA